MKICSWNVNSIRARKELLFKWLEEKRKYDIDILCLQELKVEEDIFPFNDFKEKGYECVVNAQKRYNGVSICSKLPIEETIKYFGSFFDNQKRLLISKIKGIYIINVYAPHGDLRGGEKYYYKLEWYEKFLNWLKENFSLDLPIIMVGDFNVALEDIDVYDPELLKDSIGTMPEEREALKKLINWGFIDTFRYLYPEKQQFTWWDYIGGAIWKNEGMRIDYIFCTKPLIEKLKDVEVDLWPRRRRKPTPSDHAPIIAEFEI